MFNIKLISAFLIIQFFIIPIISACKNGNLVCRQADNKDLKQMNVIRFCKSRIFPTANTCRPCETRNKAYYIDMCRNKFKKPKTVDIHINT